jgi:hypothetical protein
MSKPGLAGSARAALMRLWGRADAHYPRSSRAVLFVGATAAMRLVFGGGWLGLLVDAALIVLAIAYWRRLSQLWADSTEPDHAPDADEAGEPLYADVPADR